MCRRGGVGDRCWRSVGPPPPACLQQTGHDGRAVRCNERQHRQEAPCSAAALASRDMFLGVLLVGDGQLRLRLIGRGRDRYHKSRSLFCLLLSVSNELLPRYFYMRAHNTPPTRNRRRGGYIHNSAVLYRWGKGRQTGRPCALQLQEINDLRTWEPVSVCRREGD